MHLLPRDPAAGVLLHAVGVLAAAGVLLLHLPGAGPVLYCTVLYCTVLYQVLGLSLTLLGFLTFIVSPQLEAALTHLVQTWTALAGGQYRTI